MASGSFNPAVRVVRNPHFWFVLAIFAIIVILHYPQQFPVWGTVPFSSLGLTRHAVERVLLLVPIAYAGFVFGLGGGIASLVAACFIMLPRVIILSSTPVDAIFESAGVILIGGLLNLWFYMHRRSIAQRKRDQEILTEIIDGSPIPAFAINNQHKVTHWNTALESLSGIKREDVIGTDGQWQPFYPEKRPVMADLIVDGASPGEIEVHYQDKYKSSRLIDGAYEGEDYFHDLRGTEKWLRFTASPISHSDGKIAGAIETLEDVTERRKAEDNLRYYLQEITRAQEEERKRIARELHDSTAQNLIALLRQLDNLLTEKKNLPVKEVKALWGFHERIRDVLQEVRQFSRDLRPSILDDLGLLPSLEWVAGEIKNEYGLEISLEVVGSERRLSQEAELLLFRIVQEALRNTTKHAHASRAEVKVEFSEKKIAVTIKDNGKGFQLPENIGALLYKGKLGLAGMEERVQLLGGSLKLNSELGKGTTIYVEAPI